MSTSVEDRVKEERTTMMGMVQLSFPTDRDDVVSALSMQARMGSHAYIYDNQRLLEKKESQGLVGDSAG